MRRRPTFEGLKLVYKYIQLLKQLKKFCEEKKTASKVNLELKRLEESDNFRKTILIHSTKLDANSNSIYRFGREEIRSYFIDVEMKNVRQGYCQCSKFISSSSGFNSFKLQMIEECKKNC